MRYLFPLFTTTALMVLSNSVYASDWDLDIDRNDIKVYTKSTENSKIKSFKGEMTLKAKPSEIAQFFDDVENYPNWNDGTKSVKLIEQPTRLSKIFYLIQDVPIIKDRDIVMLGSLSQDPKSYGIKVALKAQPERLPEKSEYVRIKKYDASWQFNPIGEGKMQVVFEGSFEPGGSVPAGLFNSFLSESPYKTMLKMRKTDFTKYNSSTSNDGIRNP